MAAGSQYLYVEGKKEDPMIVIHIKPTGVDRVFFSAESEKVEDSCLAAWPLIRRELKRLDKKLRNAASEEDAKGANA